MKFKTWEVYLDNDTKFSITDAEKEKLFNAMNTRGGNHSRWQMNNGTFIILSKVAYITPIEKVDEVVEDVSDTTKETAPMEDEERKLTDQEMLDRLIELSECTHDINTIHFQMIRGRDNMLGKRYFNVCDKCGRKSRFIAAGKLSEDEKTNAIEWIDKG